ncbi:hypothetical protein Scep_022096 [Stephania cephalantha]|uniref:Uncharacterized protein n=1 Tax=Stephania cephalantha TaxID=152367 RepID=A0AAP0I0Q4_9MAGN
MGGGAQAPPGGRGKGSTSSPLSRRCYPSAGSFGVPRPDWPDLWQSWECHPSYSIRRGGTSWQRPSRTQA